MSSLPHDSEYNPRLSALAGNAIEDWGDAQQNRAGLVPYPGGSECLLNRLLYGIDIANGELVGVIGMEKSRKTTFAMNIVYNIMVSKIPLVKPRIAYLTLESGQPPTRVRDLFISMASADILTSQGYDRKVSIVSPQFLRYNTRRTKPQQDSIMAALEIIKPWPVYIYGPHKKEGNTRSSQSLTKIMEYEADHGCQMVILDHAQQVHTSGVGSMQQLYAVVDLFAGAVVSHGMAGILISQVSLGSVRGAREGIERIRAVGGKRLDEEANVVFVTTQVLKETVDPATGKEYTQEHLAITMVLSRRSAPFGVKTQVNPDSGLFFGEIKGYDKELHGG